MNRRACGILLPILSIPSPYGIGDFGPWAYKFVNFLVETRQSYWQILPLTPTDPSFGNTPYNSFSAFAGNNLFISPDLLLSEGLIKKGDVEPIPPFPKNIIDYPEVIRYKNHIFDRAYQHFKTEKINLYEYEKFCAENSNWVEDYSLFMAAKTHFQGKVWNEWPTEIRNRQPEALQKLREELHDIVEREKYLQYLFFKQWFSLKKYCNQKGVQIIGDIPIYVHYDSVDVWRNPQFFKLDEEKRPLYVSGVPPDYFSSTGQLWGNPVYRWDVLKQDNYAWWIQRMEHTLKLYDWVRIDHFRGFAGYWEVPASEKTAINGRWVPGPGEDFFSTLLRHFSNLPIIAEDLGVITDDVRELMRRFNLPGMRVLLFAFSEDLPTNPYAPHNHIKECIVYTGTHDNNTVRGWFENEAMPQEKERISEYIGRKVSSLNVHWEFVRLAMMSVANTAIIPIQDILGLGQEARMNKPATTEGNYKWRLSPELITSKIAAKLREMTEIYGRSPKN